MTASDVLVRQLERELDSFLKTVRSVPEDKLDWVPQEGMRSARDQAQEVATIVGDHWELYAERKMEWSPESFAAYVERRKKVHSVDDLEARLREDTKKLIEFVRGLSTDELMAPVQMPWPGDFRLVDTITYHQWNMSYHEGQINYILQMLGVETLPF